jgi:hypothetical protein
MECSGINLLDTLESGDMTMINVVIDVSRKCASGGVEQGVVYSRLHRTSYSISYLW